MSDHLEQLDYYTLLGVARDASVDEVRKAFRAFARRYHPDRFGNAPDKQSRATAIYRRGAEGLEVLVDPASRKAYDAALDRGILRLTANDRKTAPKSDPKELGIKSPKAREFYEMALKAIEQDDYKSAWRALRAANAAEPGNFLIEARLEQVGELIGG